METAIRQISNIDGSIYLFDLYKYNGEFSFEPCLVFEKAKTESCWDNEDYVFKFFRRLKKNKKTELEQFCIDNDFNYDTTKKELLAIFKTSKYLNFWKS
jgi:hypothetical protein